VLAGLLTLLVALGASAGSAYAASPAEPGATAVVVPPTTMTAIRADEQYVFSMGIVEQVSVSSLTIGFGDGASETYALSRETTVQTQNGDALRPADLKIGEMVIVFSVENEATARTIVSGGAAGFHEAGPGDIRGHDTCECEDRDAHAPSATGDAAP
jgi:hypothetical protein